MEITVRKVDDVTVFDLKGDLIMGKAADSLRARLHEEIEGGARRFIVNLQKVTYLDSSGAGTILAAHTSAINAGGRCNFCAAPQRVISILTVVRLIKVLNLLPDEASALSDLTREAPAGM